MQKQKQKIAASRELLPGSGSRLLRLFVATQSAAKARQYAAEHGIEALAAGAYIGFRATEYEWAKIVFAVPNNANRAKAKKWLAASDAREAARFERIACPKCRAEAKRIARPLAGSLLAVDSESLPPQSSHALHGFFYDFPPELADGWRIA